MPDLRRELQFGIFVTPQAAQAEAVLELAMLADVLGLDLVSFQDHPYQARFLDTWTLLSVVAAPTANIHVAPNVANLPLRPPAVLARAWRASTSSAAAGSSSGSAPAPSGTGSPRWAGAGSPP